MLTCSCGKGYVSSFLQHDINPPQDSPKEACLQDRLPKQGTATISAIIKLGTQEAAFDLCVDLDHLRAVADSDEENVEPGVHVGEKTTIRGFAWMDFTYQLSRTRLLLIAIGVFDSLANGDFNYLQR